MTKNIRIKYQKRIIVRWLIEPMKKSIRVSIIIRIVFGKNYLERPSIKQIEGNYNK